MLCDDGKELLRGDRRSGGVEIGDLPVLFGDLPVPLLQFRRSAQGGRRRDDRWAALATRPRTAARTNKA